MMVMFVIVIGMLSFMISCIALIVYLNHLLACEREDIRKLDTILAKLKAIEQER